MKLCVMFSLLLSCTLSLRDVTAQVPSVIRVEIDWMADATHSHRPSVAEMEAVRQMFACHGITFIYVIDDSIQHFNTLRLSPSDTNNFFGYNNGLDTYGGIKAARFDNNGGGWHYCVFGHQYQGTNYQPSGSSGLANATQDFIVTLGSFSGQVGSSWDRAATFAHELGHNLGLNHNGDMGNEALSGSFAPTVPSIMTYFYQLAGVKTNLECRGLVTPGVHLFKDLDYSNGRGCAVDENFLYESYGIGMRSVDWNCNGTFTGIVPQDISNADTDTGWCGVTGNRTILTDYDEWSHIRDLTAVEFRNDPSVRALDHVVFSCITASERERARTLASCPQPAVLQETCINAKMYYVESSGPGGDGRCSSRFNSFLAAYNAVVNGDVLFLSAGTYATGGTILTKPCVLAGPGGAVLGQ